MIIKIKNYINNKMSNLFRFSAKVFKTPLEKFSDKKNRLLKPYNNQEELEKEHYQSQKQDLLDYIEEIQRNYPRLRRSFTKISDSVKVFQKFYMGISAPKK